MKKKFLLVAFVLLGIFFTSCSQYANENPQDTVLKGTIKFAHEGNLYLIGYADSINKILGKKTTIDTTKIDRNGEYRFSIHAQSANEYELKLMDTILVTDIYIAPGNKVILNFDEIHSDPYFSKNDMEGKYNDFRVKLSRKFYFEPEVKQMYYISANYLHIDQFDSFVKMRRNQQMTFFDDYFKGQKPDPEFEKYARAEINYQYGIDKLMFLWKKRIKNIDIFPDSSYYSDISKKGYLENPDALNSPAYIHFLNLYINNMYGEKMVKNAIRNKDAKPINTTIEKYKLTLSTLNKPYRDIVLYNIITTEMNSAESDALFRNKSKPSIDILIDWLRKKYPEKGL
jgi:hypothetical protein